MITRLCILLIVLAPLTGAAQQLYRWVDAQGKVHYSDAPPPPGARGVKTLPPAAGGGTPAASPSKSWQEKEMEFRQRRAAEAEAQARKERAEEEARQRRANCETARSRLRLLESGERLVTTNAQGEREFLDDAARERALDEARKAVETWCR